MLSSYNQHDPTTALGKEWCCNECGVIHEPQFDSCWKCGAERCNTQSHLVSQSNKDYLDNDNALPTTPTVRRPQFFAAESLQFNVRSVLVFTAAASVWATAVFSVTDPFAVPLVAFLLFVVTFGLITMIVRHGTPPRRRYFCVGALITSIFWMGFVVYRHYAVNKSLEHLANLDAGWEVYRQELIISFYRLCLFLLPVAFAAGGLLGRFYYWIYDLASHIEYERMTSSQ